MNELYMLFFEHFFDNVNTYVDKEIYMSTDILTMISCMTSAEFAVDRTGLLNKYSKFNIGIPKHIENYLFDMSLKYEYRSIDEICYYVSSYLIQKANRMSKKIAVLWSGGVDSTLVVCAFLKNKKEINLNNFCIFLSVDSISENEYFFNHCIKNQCYYKIFDSNKYSQFMNETYSKYLIISGHLGDELHGNKFCLIHPEYYGLNYAKVLFTIYKEIFLCNINDEVISKLVKEHLSIFKTYFNSIFDFKIKNIEDFVWALGFMCKWCHLRIDNALRCKNLDLLNQYYPFFSHKLFQSWALYNKKYNKSSTLNPYIHTELYKKEFKDYIFRFDNNINYLNKKGKINSLVEYTNTKNSNEFVIYSNGGLEVHKINKTRNNKYRAMYEIHKYLKHFYKSRII